MFISHALVVIATYVAINFAGLLVCVGIDVKRFSSGAIDFLKRSFHYVYYTCSCL